MLSQKVIFGYSFIILLFYSSIVKNLLSFLWKYISFVCYFSVVYLLFLFLVVFYVSFPAFSQLFSGNVVEIFVVLLANLMSIKSSAPLWITFFEVLLSTSFPDYSAWLRSFWRIANIPRMYLPLKFLIIFLPKF